MSSTIYLLIAMTCWACWQLANKVCLRYISPIEAQIVFALAGTAFIPFFAWGKGAFREVAWPGVGFAVLASALGTIATIAYSSALAHKPVADCIPFVAAYPSIAILLSALVLGESFTWTKAAGLALVMIGVVIAR